MRNISKTTTEHTVVKSGTEVEQQTSPSIIANRSIIIFTWSAMMAVSVKRYALVYRLSGVG